MAHKWRQESVKMVLEVLIADDDFEGYIHRFEKAFHGKARFKGAENAGEALNFINEGRDGEHYGLVILDYNPPINGFQTAIKIKAVPYDIKIIGFSSEWKEDEVKQVGLYYFSDFEPDIAHAVADILKMDQKTYERDIKPHFDFLKLRW